VTGRAHLCTCGSGRGGRGVIEAARPPCDAPHVLNALPGP
jgi:hypothetical protein